VYKQQKDSFRNLLAAMHKAMKAIEAQWDDGDWRPISHDKVNAFDRAASEERLFVDSRTDRALELFKSVMCKAAQYEDERPDSQDVRHAYSNMTLISDRLSQHFRNRIGLESTSAEPLFDTEVLGACLLINTYHFPDHKLPTKGPLTLREDETAEELVAAGKQHVELLESDLRRLKEAMGKNAGFYYQTIALVERYLAALAG
jgi:hypothetical protein